MTNAILKRLATKGFISMRKINARNIHYLVTADGIDLIARRSYRYLRRTVGHVVRYKEAIRELLHDAALAPPAGSGVRRVVLVGERRKGEVSPSLRPRRGAPRSGPG